MTDHEEKTKRFDAFCDALQEFATAKNEWRANAAGERAEAIAETFSEHELARAERFAINLKREDIVSDLPPPDTIAFNDLARVVMRRTYTQLPLLATLKKSWRSDA